MKLRLLQHLHGRAVGAWRGQAAKPTLLKFMCFIKMNSKWGRLRNQLWKTREALRTKQKYTHTQKKRGKIETKTTISATTTNSNRQGQPQSAFCGFWTSGKSEHKHTHKQHTSTDKQLTHKESEKEGRGAARCKKHCLLFCIHKPGDHKACGCVCVCVRVGVSVCVCMYVLSDRSWITPGTLCLPIGWTILIKKCTQSKRKRRTWKNSWKWRNTSNEIKVDVFAL